MDSDSNALSVNFGGGRNSVSAFRYRYSKTTQRHLRQDGIDKYVVGRMPFKPSQKLDMSLLNAVVFSFIGFSAILIAQDNNQADRRTSGPVKPLSKGDADPAILAGERRAQFERLDADKNGSLSLEEFSRISALARRIGSGIGTAGTNTPEEEGNPYIPTGDMTQMFKNLDQNHDNGLTLEEFSRLPLEKSGDSVESVKKDAQNISRSTGATVGKPSLGNLDRSALFHRLDKDGDGSLDPEEFSKMTASELSSQSPTAVFHQLDADSNGKISKEEFRKLPPGPSTPPATTR